MPRKKTPAKKARARTAPAKGRAKTAAPTYNPAAEIETLADVQSSLIESIGDLYNRVEEVESAVVGVFDDHRMQWLKAAITGLSISGDVNDPKALAIAAFDIAEAVNDEWNARREAARLKRATELAASVINTQSAADIIGDEPDTDMLAEPQTDINQERG